MTHEGKYKEENINIGSSEQLDRALEAEKEVGRDCPKRMYKVKRCVISLDFGDSSD